MRIAEPALTRAPFGALLVFSSIFGCVDDPVPISFNQVHEVEQRLASWADGRWDGVLVEIGDGGRTMEVAIDVRREANEIARQGYCEVIERAVGPALTRGQQWYARLRVSGAKVHICLH